MIKIHMTLWDMIGVYNFQIQFSNSYSSVNTFNASKFNG